MKNIALVIVLVCGLMQLGCGDQKKKSTELPMGIWRGVITQQGQELPFNFTLKEGKSAEKIEMILHNGTERIVIDEVTQKGDSLLITFNFFDTEIKAKIQENMLSGHYNKRYSDEHILKFRAVFNDSNRFLSNSKKPENNVTGRYQVSFLEEDGSS
ncbi:MAG: hypothetical protein AAFO69_02675, partial [Bacteroidota bacterium]